MGELKSLISQDEITCFYIFCKLDGNIELLISVTFPPCGNMVSRSSFPQPVTGVQIVGKAQKDVSEKNNNNNNEGVG